MLSTAPALACSSGYSGRTSVSLQVIAVRFREKASTVSRADPELLGQQPVRRLVGIAPGKGHVDADGAGRRLAQVPEQLGVKVAMPRPAPEVLQHLARFKTRIIQSDDHHLAAGQLGTRQQAKAQIIPKILDQTSIAHFQHIRVVPVVPARIFFQTYLQIENNFPAH